MAADEAADLAPLFLDAQVGPPQDRAEVVIRVGAGRALVVEVSQRLQLVVVQQPKGE